MSDIEIENYHNVIRDMITKENEIRNQRTHWFLVIQGFLVAGCCSLYKDLISCSCCVNNPFLFAVIICSIIGAISSLTTMYAAWRSIKAIDMALACWDRFLEMSNKSPDDYPPVSLITSSIIKSPQDIREVYIGGKMYRKKTCLRKRIDKIWNYFDFMMPFRSLPFVFLVVWLVVFLIVC